MKQLDAKQLGVNPKTKIIDHGAFLAIVVERKSRIIMKDGEKIIEKAKAIQRVKNTPIYLQTGAPICSKTKTHLEKHGVMIMEEQ